MGGDSIETRNKNRLEKLNLLYDEKNFVEQIRIICEEMVMACEQFCEGKTDPTIFVKFFFSKINLLIESFKIFAKHLIKIKMGG